MTLWIPTKTRVLKTLSTLYSPPHLPTPGIISPVTRPQTMPDSSYMTWSDNPNAPQIPYYLHHWEISNGNGGIVGAILYGTLAYKPTFLYPPCHFTSGIVIALFFECMTALLNPDNPMRRGIKWVFLAHTVAIFSFITISCAIEGARRSNALIDNREYPGVDHVSRPGPFGYMDLNAGSTAAIISYIAFPLNQWLTDGLLVSTTSNSVA